jgi:hypothetical protein
MARLAAESISDQEVELLMYSPEKLRKLGWLHHCFRRSITTRTAGQVKEKFRRLPDYLALFESTHHMKRTIRKT